MFPRLDLRHAVQNLRKYSYITISTLPHVTCVKCKAIAAVNMKTMLDTILLLESELNNQNLANDLRLFCQELESSNHYIFNVHRNVKKQRLPRCLHIEYKEWNFIIIVLHICFIFRHLFYILWMQLGFWICPRDGPVQYSVSKSKFNQTSGRNSLK